MCTKPQAQQLNRDCKLHSSKLECVACREGFFLSQRRCFEVPKENQIENCRVNLNMTACRQCDEGFLLSFDERKCLRV